jgi:hypothetical protein
VHKQIIGFKEKILMVTSGRIQNEATKKYATGWCWLCELVVHHSSISGKIKQAEL